MWKIFIKIDRSSVTLLKGRLGQGLFLAILRVFSKQLFFTNVLANASEQTSKQNSYKKVQFENIF